LAEDAIMLWTTAADDRLRRVTAFFEAFDGRSAEHGWLWTSGDRAGAALWAPPGTDAELDGITFSLDGLSELLGDAAERYHSFWEWAESKRPAERHWYLDHLAVDETRQGEGLGVALIEHGLAFARAAGEPAFLCTSRQGNVAFYERRGFVVEDAGEAPGGGPYVWFMRSDP
jgi:ribosomal protein S18 acetylase RimI-like enzyme